MISKLTFERVYNKKHTINNPTAFKIIPSMDQILVSSFLILIIPRAIPIRQIGTRMIGR